MPSVELNRTWWDGCESDTHWGAMGENWSEPYGSSQMQWFGSLLPRIHRFVPAARILEIAPGYGRWTRYLHGLARERLAVVDLSERCIEHCRARFSNVSHIDYHVNDGRSLSMIEDASIDFAFSFDSLVHVELDVLQDYLAQLRSKLGPRGIAFIHHSNSGEFARYFDLLDKLPRGRGFLARLGLVEGSDQKRAKSVTADAVGTAAQRAGLAVVSQELINWRSRRPIDCISVIAKPDSKWAVPAGRRMVNLNFDSEAATLKRLNVLYGPGGSPTPG